MRTIIYIDGLNFYYGAVEKTPYKWLDFEALCRLLLPDNLIVKIRYFTSRVKERDHDPLQPVRQQTYLRALATFPLIEIHYGRFATGTATMPLADYPSETVKVIRTEEKRSDVNLATHLLVDAFEKRCDLAVVISNDSDLTEAIRVTQTKLGVQVGLINPHRRNRRPEELRQLPCLFFKQVPRQALADAQLPDIVHDSQGEIYKPSGW